VYTHPKYQLDAMFAARTFVHFTPSSVYTFVDLESVCPALD